MTCIHTAHRCKMYPLNAGKTAKQLLTKTVSNKHKVNPSKSVSVESRLSLVLIIARKRFVFISFLIKSPSWGLFCFSNICLSYALFVQLTPTSKWSQCFVCFFYLLSSEVERRKSDIHPSRNTADQIGGSGDCSRSRWQISPSAPFCCEEAMICEHAGRGNGRRRRFCARKTLQNIHVAGVSKK